MPERFRFAARGTRRLDRAALCVATAIPLGLIAAAGLGVSRWAKGEPNPLLWPSVFVLVACAGWQVWLLLGLVRQRCWQRVSAAYGCVRYWQSLLSGAAVLYLVVLCLGPISGIGWGWLAAVAVWQSVLLLPLAVSPQVSENWRRWMETHRAGRLNWLIAASVGLLVVGEGALRVRGTLADGARQVERVELAQWQASADELDFGSDWTAAFDVERARFRVALLSDDAPHAATLRALSQRIQQAAPGSEIVTLNLSLADASNGRLDEELATSKPDVVLAVMPACSEWAPAEVQRSLFDRDRFELARVVFGSSAEAEPGGLPAVPHVDYEAFLNESSGDLAACRTPLDEPMRRRWGRTFAALDGAVDTCRAANVPLALVVVPGELQINEGLRATLLRRCGMTTEQVDLELPQRRLAGYAQQRAVPLVDLLPHLRHCRQAVFARHQTELSERGNIEAAAAIGGWLESRYGTQMSEQLSRNE